MASRIKYSLERKDAKIAGVCATIGAMTGIDATFIRIGFVSAAVLMSFEVTLVAYVVAGFALAYYRRKKLTEGIWRSDFDRMGDVAARCPTVDAMRKDFTTNDRRMMAIDHHLSRQNDDLAREIEALREDK